MVLQLVFFSLCAIVAAPPAVLPVHDVLVPSTELAGYTLSFGADQSYSTYTFLSGGRVEFQAQMGVTGKGKWKAAKGSVRASGSHSTFCHDGDESCNPEHHIAWDVTWKNVMITSGELIVLTDSKNDKVRIFECNEKKICNATEPGSVELVQLVPGAKDRTLFNRALEHAKDPHDDDTRVIFVRGPAAKNPRKTSEVWWVESEWDGQDIAAVLEPAIGSVVPKKWTFGPSVFPVIVVVGDTPVGQSPRLRIKMMDGHCAKKSPASCENALLATVRGLFSDTAYKITDVAPAKSVRSKMEVWFMPGHKQAAADLVEKHLSKWLEPADVKEWKWGGSFDVLVVVPSH